MFQRILGLVVTAAGVVLALLIGFWAMIFLGAVAIVAAVAYFIRSRHWRSDKRRGGRDVIEGDFVVLDEDKNKNGSGRSGGGSGDNRE